MRSSRSAARRGRGRRRRSTISPPSPRRRRPRPRARRMLAGVVEQVAEDPLEPARVGLDRRAAPSGSSSDAPPGGGRRRPSRTSRPRSTGSSATCSARGVEARDLHQVVDQRPQPADVGDEQLAGPPAVGRQRVEVLAQDRRLGDERGERRPQLVRDVGDEPPVLGLGGLEPADRVGQGVGHPVEPLGPRARTRRPR